MQRNVAVSIGALACAAAIAGVFLLAHSQSAANLAHNRDAQLVPTTTPEYDGATYESLALTAESAYVLDVTTGEVLYRKNPEAQVPLASLTKVMTALVAQSTLPRDESVSVSAAAIATEGDSGLLQDEQWSLHDLLVFTLITSSNDGAAAVAEAAGQRLQHRASGGWEGTQTQAFVAAMNRRADELGLAQTFFLNPTGLDTNEEVSGGYGSARDVAHLFAHILRQEAHLLTATRNTRRAIASTAAVHTATNTNEAIGNIPGLIAGKTGYTDLAGGNLAVAFDVGLHRPVVAVVLGSTREYRFTDMAELVQATYNYYNEQ